MPAFLPPLGYPATGRLLPRVPAFLVLALTSLAGCTTSPAAETTTAPAVEPPEGVLAVLACLETCERPLPGAEVWLAARGGEPVQYLGETRADGRFHIFASPGTALHPVVGHPNTTYEGVATYTVPVAGQETVASIVVYPAETSVVAKISVGAKARVPTAREVIDVPLASSGDPNARLDLERRLAAGGIEVAWATEAGGNVRLRPCIGTTTSRAQFVGDEPVADPDGRLRVRLRLTDAQVKELVETVSPSVAVAVCVQVEGTIGVPEPVDAEVHVSLVRLGKAPFSIVADRHP